jgi:hypothetical protein
MMTIENSKQDKKERYGNLRSRIDIYKPAWDKHGVIQYKSEHIAILQRRTGMQVEFIIAFDDLTKEGYRLMALDERESSGEYFYFQNIKFIVSTSANS